MHEAGGFAKPDELDGLAPNYRKRLTCNVAPPDAALRELASYGFLISDEAQHTEARPRAAPARKLQRAPGAAGWCAGRIGG